MISIYTDKFFETLDENKSSAFFDIDHTIIFPVKGRFYNDKDKFKWNFNKNAKEVLQEISQKYTIIFVTNQLKYDEIVEQRIKDMLSLLEIETIVFISTDRDIYRKPGIGFLEYVEANFGKEILNIDDKSFHCGDAAGRPERTIDDVVRVKADFSDDDFWFAQHLEINFFTPEEIFDEQIDPSLPYKKNIIKSPPIDYTLIEKIHKIIRENDGIMIMGLQGSGKSYLKRWLESDISERLGRNVVVFNRDEKLGPKKYNDNDFFILDNVNLTEHSRNNYPSDILSKKIAKIYIDLDPKECIRGIKYRVALGAAPASGSAYISDITIYTSNKYKEIPGGKIDLILKKRPVLTDYFPPYLLPDQ